LRASHTATPVHAESQNEISKPFFNDPAVDLLQLLTV
jgi:hypothetical protein